MLLEKRGIAYIYVLSLQESAHTAPRDLLHFHHTFADFRRPGRCRFQQLSDGMIGKALCSGGNCNQILLGDAVGVYLGDFKISLGDGSGLAEDHSLHL